MVIDSIILKYWPRSTSANTWHEMDLRSWCLELMSSGKLYGMLKSPIKVGSEEDTCKARIMEAWFSLKHFWSGKPPPCLFLVSLRGSLGKTLNSVIFDFFCVSNSGVNSIADLSWQFFLLFGDRVFSIDDKTKGFLRGNNDSCVFFLSLDCRNSWNDNWSS